jgi:hypothetical protein
MYFMTTRGEIANFQILIWSSAGKRGNKVNFSAVENTMSM